jgi:hypothetical protein
MDALVTWFDQQFRELNSGWRELVQAIGGNNLYQNCGNRASAGEYVVRSARVVEQTFGGINSNLWDDPFEWTLPETLTTPEKLFQYFDEVEATRRQAFARFTTGEDLLKKIMAPAGETQLLTLLLDTLVRAGHYHLDARHAVDELTRKRNKAAGPGSF